jgi:SAM-dependent methyltransferase
VSKPFDFDSIYQHRFSAAERDALTRVWRILVRDFFQRWIGKDDSVLDVGAGFCNFINHVSARHRVAFDANPLVARYCGPGTEFVCGKTIASVGRSGPFHVAFMSNFLEHLSSPEEILDLLSNLRQFLAPGARVIILQPNFALVGAQYFDFIDHKVILTDKSLIEALELSGYDIIFLKRRFLPYTSKSRLPKWSWLVKLYLLLPPAQWLFGKQSLVVAVPRELPPVRAG